MGRERPPRRVLSGGGRSVLVVPAGGQVDAAQRVGIGAGIGPADRTKLPRRVVAAVQSALVVAIAWPGCGEHEVDPLADRGGDERTCCRSG
jgi:hypothetical protein